MVVTVHINPVTVAYVCLNAPRQHPKDQIILAKEVILSL